MIYHKITLIQKGHSVGECLLTESNSEGFFPGIITADDRLGSKIMEGYLRAERLIFRDTQNFPSVMIWRRDVMIANMFVEHLLGEKLPQLPTEKKEYSKKIEIGDVKVQVVETVSEDDLLPPDINERSVLI